MSFRCDGCGCHQPDGEKPRLVTAKVRRVNYRFAVGDDWVPNGTPRGRGSNGSGIEIARERKLCGLCALAALPPTFEKQKQPKEVCFS